MHDPAPDREPLGNERWILLGAFLLALVLLVAIVLDDYEPTRLAPVFMLLSWFPLIALHELGHALVARALGWKVDAMVVGFGPEALRFALFAIPCTVKMYPLGGYVSPGPRSLAGIRLKSVLVYAAGPGIEALLVIAIAIGLGPDALLTRTDAIPVIALQALAIAATLSVVTNLVPRRIQTEHGESYTDGMGILVSLMRPARSYTAQVRDAHEARIRSARDSESALSACEEAYRSLGDDPHLRSVMVAALERLGADVTGRALPERVLERLRRA